METAGITTITITEGLREMGKSVLEMWRLVEGAYRLPWEIRKVVKSTRQYVKETEKFLRIIEGYEELQICKELFGFVEGDENGNTG